MPGDETWTVDRRQLSVTNFYLEVWSRTNATGGATTVTVTCSGPPDQMRIVLTEYSGIATSSHVDATVAATDTGATADAGDITTTGPNRLIHVAAASDGNDDADTFTPGPGYTIHDLGPDPSGSDKTMTQHRVAATAGDYGTTMGNINDSWAAVAVAYRPSDDSPPVDGGPLPDAGSADGGSGSDAGSADGGPGSDGGSGTVDGSTAREAAGGCGCRSASDGPPDASWLAVVAALLLRRRRFRSAAESRSS
jgi:MYXO-CTERM domain-containing protein